MTNTFRHPLEEEISEMAPASFHKHLVMLGILCIALCAAYIISVRVVEAGEYALRGAQNSRDAVRAQYNVLGTQLDSLRSLSAIEQAPVLVGFEQVQKPLYLNMDEAQSVAVAGTAH